MYPGDLSKFWRNTMNQYLLDDEIDALWSADDLDAMIGLPGGRGGRVRRDISPWPSLMNRTIQALQKAIGFLTPPINLNSALGHINGAEALLNSAGREVRRVMSGAQLTAVLDQLSNAAIRIQAARKQAQGGSLIGGISLLDPRMSLKVAIENIRYARDAVNLRLIP
jgi:hypothetical protein